MIDGFPLSFFLPLVVHALAGLTTGVTGVLAFRASTCRGRDHRWGTRYLWAYTVVFLTAIILSVRDFPADAYLFALAMLGYGLALGAYAARRFWREPRVRRVLGKQWVVAHILGMIGSYVVLWTAFYVDNAHLIPGLKELPPLTCLRTALRGRAPIPGACCPSPVSRRKELCSPPISGPARKEEAV